MERGEGVGMVFQYTHPDGVVFRDRVNSGMVHRESPIAGQDKGGSASDPPLSILLPPATWTGPETRPGRGGN